MMEKIAKLIDVKSIVTLLLTAVFCALCVMDRLPTEFLTIYTVIIGFYFGTQSQKKAGASGTGYTGAPQGTVVEDSAEPVYETVDTAMANDVHPPDSATARIGFKY
ncbi:MAG: hypothetical protein IJW45_08660 [Oscillospiraceae bacterium]|nr:hypothetical protein [Oscillospiraceae bacterium]